MTADAAARITEAASAVHDALDGAQRAKASFAFDDEDERRNWGYFPRDFHGLPLGDMDAAQQKLALALVASALSLHAFAQVTTIIALENVLDQIEGGVIRRDPSRYFVSLFGSPNDELWGWRFEGHHVSLNFGVANGKGVSPAPIFLGSNPAEVRHDDRSVIRPCGEEEDAARELLLSLDAERLARAVICDTAPPDIVLTNAPRVPDAALPGAAGNNPFIGRQFDALTDDQRQALRFDRAAPVGLSASDMDASQRGLLQQLVDVYLHRLPSDLARIEREKLDGDDISFAWAGEDRPRRAHYYRLQGPSLLVEYDNTQNDANHIHAVWRDPTADFGADLLRRHIAEAH
ncbi:MAG: DUF3500 domain-containing protein [Dehalococcoidia bacterium]